MSGWWGSRQQCVSSSVSSVAQLGLSWCYGLGRVFHADSVVNRLWYAWQVPSRQQECKGKPQQKKSKKAPKGALKHHKFFFLCVRAPVHMCVQSHPRSMITHRGVCVCVCSLGSQSEWWSVKSDRSQTSSPVSTHFPALLNFTICPCSATSASPSFVRTDYWLLPIPHSSLSHVSSWVINCNDNQCKVKLSKTVQRVDTYIVQLHRLWQCTVRLSSLHKVHQFFLSTSGFSCSDL